MTHVRPCDPVVVTDAIAFVGFLGDSPGVSPVGFPLYIYIIIYTWGVSPIKVPIVSPFSVAILSGKVLSCSLQLLH